MKLKHLLLGVSLTAFAMGFADIGAASQWGLARPLGAVSTSYPHAASSARSPVRVDESSSATRTRGAMCPGPDVAGGSTLDDPPRRRA